GLGAGCGDARSTSCAAVSCPGLRLGAGLAQRQILATPLRGGGRAATMTGPLFPGTCRYCKCTEERPCGFYRGGEAVSCTWLHGTVPMQTVCTGPECLW